MMFPFGFGKADLRRKRSEAHLDIQGLMTRSSLRLKNPFVWAGNSRMSAEARIKEKLIVALRPTRLDVINESEMHAGHRSSPGTGESHFRVLIVSEAFAGKSRVERHRMVNEVLKGDVGGAVHALALATYAPGEAIG